MGKIKRMDQIKLILQTYLTTGSIKGTARQLKVSKNTIRSYLRRCQSYLRSQNKTESKIEDEEELSHILSLDDATLGRIFYLETVQVEDNRAQIFSEKISYWLAELRRVGVTRQLLWEEYREEHTHGYGYSMFCEKLKREIGRRDLTLALDHTAGEEMMVDFTGKKMQWVDEPTGEVHVCEILVAVFPHSQYSFAIALPSQKLPDFIHGLNQALLFFEGVPKVILSDNLKSYVTRADRYEPQFTQLCEQLAAHFQVDLQATRAGKPKDKASVENAVNNVYRRIYAPLRNETFHSLEALNAGIRQQLLWHNDKPYQKKEGTRKSVFEKYELPQMRSLPSELFEIKKITRAKVQRNYHVFLGEEKNYYSVPHQYVGQKVEIIYSSKTVEVFLAGCRVTTHTRLISRGGHRYQTKDDHMPQRHQKWKKTKGYDEAYFLTQAEKIGAATRWAIQNILVSRIHVEQSYKSCQGVFHLAKKYSNERLEAAALRCQKINKVSYTMLKRILNLNLDLVRDQMETPKDALAIPVHKNIRGAESYV